MTAPARGRGPLRLPVLGHVPAFLRDKLGFLERSARELGDVAALDLGGATVLLSHPDDVRHVLVSRHGTYRKSPRITGAAARRLLGTNVLTSEGTEHQAQRRRLQPLIGPRAVASLVGLVPRRARELTDGWQDGSIVDLGRAMHGLTLRCTVEMLFGERLAQRRPELGTIIELRRAFVDGAFSSPLPRFDAWPTPQRYRFRRSRPRLVAIVAEEIAAAGRERGEIDGVLRELAAEADAGTAAEIAEQLAAVAVAGYETPRHLLTWAGDALARHAEVQERLRREIDGTVVGLPCASDLGRLPLAARVVSETLRLYPPTWLLVRIATKDDVLPSRAAIAAGTKVYLSPYVLHRDRRWFADPRRFDPDRFAAAQTPPTAYLPFGAGARQCLGEALARAEAALILATILSQWTLVPVGGQPVPPVPRVALEPEGPVLVRVCRRAAVRHQE